MAPPAMAPQARARVVPTPASRRPRIRPAAVWAMASWAMASDGVAGFLAYLGSLSPIGSLATVDLVLALLIGTAFIAADAPRRGLDPRPFVVLTVVSGSLGLLAYLARRDSAPHEARTHRSGRR